MPDDFDPAGPADHAGSADGLHDRTAGPGDAPTGPQDSTVGSGDFPTGPPNFADGPAEFSAPGDFGTGPGTLSTGLDDFPTGPGDFSTGPGGYTGQPPTALDPLGPPGAYPDDPFGPAGSPGAPPPPPGRTNGWAIAAFILGLLGGSILGVIFAIVALRQIGDSRQRGKGLAVAGLALSIIWGAAVAVYLVLGSSGTPAGQSASGGSNPPVSASSPSASSSGRDSSPGGRDSSSRTSVFALRAGQCFQNPPANQTVLGITYVTVVPCTTLHNAQVFAEFPATGSAYPGSTSIKGQADQGCHSRVTANLETSKITSTMSLNFLYPLPASWAQGHRTITCLVVDSKTDLKSSLLRAHPAH